MNGENVGVGVRGGIAVDFVGVMMMGLPSRVYIVHTRMVVKISAQM